VTVWAVSMKLLVDDETTEVSVVKRRLALAVADVDAHPGFVTAEHWMVQAMATPPAPFTERTSSGAWQGDWMPQGKAKRRRLGAGP
jgi:hypothetical protein